MYQKCPTCKSKGLFKKETCPICLGERIIHKESGLPPSKYVTPFTYPAPYIPYNPYSPCYPLTNPIITTGGTNVTQAFTNLTN